MRGALLPLIFVSYGLASQVAFQPRRVLDSSIDQFITNILAEWNSPGGIAVSVVVQSDDGIWNVESQGYGISNADSREVTPESLFCIASNSKLFTVLATGLLIHNESLDISWDTKIASIVPEWGLEDTYASQETTITDTMSHRTGMPRHDLMYEKFATVSGIISRLRYLRKSAGFRETWQYNNCMYTLLSYLPPVLTGIGFPRFVHDNIFAPLGLTSTTYDYHVALASGNMADGFGREGVNRTENVLGKGIPHAMIYPGRHLPGGDAGNFKDGAGGVIMSAHDAATWLQTLLLEGKNPLTNSSVVPSVAIQKAASGITVNTGEAPAPELSPVVYGGGQSRGTYRGHELIEHGGSTIGFKTQITRFPSDRFGVSVFSNDDDHGSSMIEIIKYRIIDHFFGLSPIDWNSRLKAKTYYDFKNYEEAIVPRPQEPSTPSAGFQTLAGIYTNNGYGDIELCLLEHAAEMQSESCQELASNVDILLPGSIEEGVPTLVAKWDKFWSSHLKLQHFDGNVFNVSILDSRSADVNSSHPYWVGSFTDRQFIQAEFDSDKGFGVTGGAWGAGAGVNGPTGFSIQEKAEVWFAKG